jgi:bifunctional DNA-binding transcriptional regulator/antitoxin component of YhaV-PrlF toxin-antitoxin module
MARVRLSEAGDLHVPLALRETLGLVAGGELDLTARDGKLIVAPVSGDVVETPVGRRLSIDALLAKRIPYNGPPLTDEVINRAILHEAKRRFERVQRQWNEADDENAVS